MSFALAAIAQPALATTPADDPTRTAANPTVAKLAQSLLGTWRCTETVAQPDGTKLKKSGILTFASELDGHWLVSVLSWTPTATSPGMTMVEYRTWDEKRKSWQSYAFDSRGTFSHSETTRADEKTMVWAGTEVSDGEASWWRWTEEIVSSTRMTFAAEGSADGKTYSPMAHGSCER